MTYVVPKARIEWLSINVRLMGVVLGLVAVVVFGFDFFSHGSPLFEAAGLALGVGAGASIAIGSFFVPVAKWLAARRNDPPPEQYAHLEGSQLDIYAPSRARVELSEPHAVVVGVSDETASVRWLGPDGDVLLHLAVSRGTTFEGARGAEPPPWTNAYAERYRSSGLRFGDGLLAALDAGREQNEYLTHIAMLERVSVRDASAPIVVELSDSDDEAAPYRQGQPEPGHPGFGRWLARNGKVLHDTLTLSAEHLVAACVDGRRRAFPVGAMRARRVRTSLFLAGAHDGAVEHEIECGSPALAAALAQWSSTRGPTSFRRIEGTRC